MDNPYHIIKKRHITEKAVVLQNLKDAESNPSLARFKGIKYVFVVDGSASKQQIAVAVESIYREKKIKVVKVNTISVKPKNRRVRGRSGTKPGFKKAVVTLQPGDSLDNV